MVEFAEFPCALPYKGVGIDRECQRVGSVLFEVPLFGWLILFGFLGFRFNY